MTALLDLGAMPLPDLREYVSARAMPEDPDAPRAPLPPIVVEDPETASAWEGQSQERSDRDAHAPENVTSQLPSKLVTAREHSKLKLDKETTPHRELRGERASQINPEHVAWLWPSRLPARRLTLVAGKPGEGKPGEGKSAVALDVIARMSRGSQLPDGYRPPAPITCAILSAEDDPTVDSHRESTLVAQPDTPAQVLTLLARVSHDLQAVEDPREAAQLVEQSEAITYLAKKARVGHELQNRAAEIALRAKRRAGELLAEMPKNLGGRPLETGNSVLPVSSPTLEELGINKIDSSRWQAVAAVPEERFEQYLATVQEQTADLELTTAGLLSTTKHLAGQRARKSEIDARQIEPADDYAEGPGWRMFGGEFQDRLSVVPDGTIDAIVTDPPYNADSLPLWGELAEHAARLLKPQGLLIALSGKINLLDVLDQLRTHLHYGWQYAQPMPGQSSRILARHVFQKWKPWLVFSNGAWPSGSIDWHEDTTPPSVMQKSYRWQQDGAPAAYLIAHLTDEGDVACDPFAGVGSYGEAVVGLGREFIGCEADSGRFAKAVERLRSQDA
jgi:hypothetical protein